MMPLIKVTDMSYNRSVPGRILGYGRFVMESAGQDQALREVNWVPDPDQHLPRHLRRDLRRRRPRPGPHRRVDGDGTDGTGDDGHPTPPPERPGPPSGPPGPPHQPESPGDPGSWSTGIRVRPAEPGEDPPGGRSLYQSPDLRGRSSRDADTGPIPIQRPPTEY